MAWGNRERLTPEFRRNRPKALQRDNHTCQLRWKGCTVRATEVDHVINRDSWPCDKPGMDDLGNLQSVCHACHVKKTSIEQQRKRRENRERCRHRWTRMKHPGLN